MDKRIFLTLVLLLGAMFALKAVKDARRSSVLASGARAAAHKSQHSDALPKPDPFTVKTPLVHASFRPLNFALLRGGFSSVDEFFERVHDDPVLHAFYGDCADRNASMFALPEDITAFSTFRKGDKIKWAQKPLLIKKGEYVMSFCGKTVLARCGNLISVSPMQPSEDVPPAVLETPSEPVETPLILEASAAPPAAVLPPVAAPIATADAKSHRFFFVPPFYVPPGGSHGGPPPAAVVPPPTTVVTPPPTTVGPPPPVTTPPPVTAPPPPITTAPPPPPPSAPPAPPAGHMSGDEFSGHQALLTLFVGLFVIGLLKLTTR